MWRLLARLGDRRAAGVFIAPPLALVIVMAIFPLVMSLGLSFVHWNLSNPDAGIAFAGVDHWARLFEDTHFHGVALNTVLYVIVGVPIQYGLGLLLAVVLNAEIKARNFFRVLFLLPMMLSPIAISFVVGRVMFNEAAGPVNDLLIRSGIAPVAWLSDSVLAFVTVLIVDTWQWTPFMMLILLAGLQSVSEEVVEAGRIDTRSDWQAFWRVTFPLLLPWTVTALLIRSVEMLKIVDVIVVLTNGGPGIATESLTIYAYRVGIRNFDLGYASTLAFTLLIVTVVAAMLFLGVLRKLVLRAVE
ncbi:MAG: sugar ABC transporter permease [Alphaproteobacteria bacterium]